ncbi:MAG: hypothetical protein AUJ85_05165 [Elusimicrobia bacterium CG1_02_37_114]|nr:MAG: hypothetical protein AUJ85_05165 [Elusimicrobia bacterium CG1_02_37_114]
MPNVNKLITLPINLLRAIWVVTIELLLLKTIKPNTLLPIVLPDLPSRNTSYNIPIVIIMTILSILIIWLYSLKTIPNKSFVRKITTALKPRTIYISKTAEKHLIQNPPNLICISALVLTADLLTLSATVVGCFLDGVIIYPLSSDKITPATTLLPSKPGDPITPGPTFFSPGIVGVG